MSDALPNLIILAQAEGAPPGRRRSSNAATTGPAAEKEPFPPFDSTFFPSTLLWLAITFVALYLLIWQGRDPPDRRHPRATVRGRIEGDIAAAERMKAESEEAAAGYEKSLAEARAGGAQIAEAARSKARAAADAKRAEIEADAGREACRRGGRHRRDQDAALAEVGSVARDAAGAIVKTLDRHGRAGSAKSATPSTGRWRGRVRPMFDHQRAVLGPRRPILFFALVLYLRGAAA